MICSTSSIGSRGINASAAIALEEKIRQTIPLSEAMQFTISALDIDAIRVTAPLPPNVNIHGTGFAGSIYSLAVLTGWALCTHVLDELDFDAELVVGRGEIRYRAPVQSGIECSCACSEEQRTAFTEGLRAQGKGKMVLEINVGDAPLAVLQATFYAIAH